MTYTPLLSTKMIAALSFGILLFAGPWEAAAQVKKAKKKHQIDQNFTPPESITSIRIGKPLAPETVSQEDLESKQPERFGLTPFQEALASPPELQSPIRVGTPMPLPELTREDLIGRWNLTVDMDGKDAPSWLEVKLSGLRTLVGSFVGEDGSARPVSEVHFENGKLSFSIPPQWQDTDKPLVFEGYLENDQLMGHIQHPMGGRYAFRGERAPVLIRDKTPKWSKPIALFNGKDLKGWHADKDENQWTVKNGLLHNPKAGANLITDEKFEDFKLTAEFRIPEGSNAGIYLRGRYEVQIADNIGLDPSSLYFGGVYGFLSPNEMVAKPAGEWQTFEITLVGRMLTVVANGKTIICDQAIPGITGGALDSNEALPGPIMLQGDHGPVDFRKLELRIGE